MTYSLFTAWTTDRSNRVMLGFTTSTNFQVRLPAGDANSTLLHLIVRVRDVYLCTTEVDMQYVSVIPDMAAIDTLINTIQLNVQNTDNNTAINSNSFVRILAGGDQNAVSQVLTYHAQIFNLMASQSLELAIASMCNDLCNYR